MFCIFWLVVSCVATRVYYIQQRTFHRSPIKNDARFNIFNIQPTLYTLDKLSQPRNCSVKNNCILIDYVNMLRMIQVVASNQSDYFYMIEDDTYYCPYDNLLERLLETNSKLNISALFTGIGATGYAIKTSLIPMFIDSIYLWKKDLMIHHPARYGVDLIFWDKKSRMLSSSLYRTKVHLNVHLYQGSTRASGDGRPQHVYGACFERSCGKGYINSFNHAKCDAFDLMSQTGNCASKGLLPVGYISRHCMRIFNISSSNGLIDRKKTT